MIKASQLEMGPDPTRAYFWPAVNKRPTRLWPGYFLTRPEEIFFRPEGKKLNNLTGYKKSAACSFKGDYISLLGEIKQSLNLLIDINIKITIVVTWNQWAILQRKSKIQYAYIKSFYTFQTWVLMFHLSLLPWDQMERLEQPQWDEPCQTMESQTLKIQN